MEQIGLGPRNVRIIGVILVALIVISGAVFIGFQLGGNQQAVSTKPTERAGRTPTGLASGSPVSSTGAALSAVPPISTPASTPVMTATVSKRLDIAGPHRNVVNVIDVAANKSTTFFTSPGAISGTIFSAAWSPDGKQVLISHNWNLSNYDYRQSVTTLNEDGTHAADIIRAAPTSMGIEAAYAYRDAIWSPDGAHIAIRYQSGGDFGIWLANADGTNCKRLQSSDIGDWPRFWSIDGRWVIGISSSDGSMYGESIDSAERVPITKIKGVQVYDQRYFPWRITDNPKCSVTGTWYKTGGAYWDCE